VETWAHSVNDLGERHRLRDHLLGTAALARSFGAAFGAADLTAALGLLHDAGKASCTWQDGLLRAEARGGPVGLDHKTLGARLLRSTCGPGVAAVLGHHGGLPDLGEVKAAARALTDVDESVRVRLVRAVPEAGELLACTEPVWPASWADPATTEMGLRLAFSALVDADFLDTAAHFAGRAAPGVAAPVDMTALVRRFESGRTRLLEDRQWSPIDDQRRGVYESAVAAAGRDPGIFRLPAPTGSGKTLAAAGFGLHHAAQHRKSRVIVAVPFITITEQNAAVYRSLLGDEVVVEHHSSVDPDVRRTKLGVDNWDAPFIVTTTVQLFDSLFGRKPARSRKVHRLANAVIVLDEVQALPTALLPTILSGLRTLTERFGATILLASATQPTFQALGAWRDVADQITEIVEDPVRLYRALRRVEYRWWLQPRPTLEEVADAAAAHQQALLVLNTVADARRTARRVAEQAPGAALHLSTRMCPAHRRAVLDETRARLADGRPVVLVATQLIEAGVDLDFPVVYRALAPADSLQQAAGRANREGRRREPGLVIVFDADGAGSPPSYRTPVALTRRHFGPGQADPDDIAALARYYTALYHAMNVDDGARAAAIQRNRASLAFRSVTDGPLVDAATGLRDSTKAFRMLDDDSVPVVITGYTETARVTDLLADLRSGHAPSTRVFRQLQAFTVGLPGRVAARPDVAALLRPVVEGLCEWVGEYDRLVGIDDAATTVHTVW
jgi:CRISPR-associated endonuclease/helicase Cas3